MRKPEFLYVIYIETTPDTLWRALTDPAFTRRYWMNCELISDWKVGSPMTMTRDGEVKNECVIRESDPPRRLAYDWVSVHDPEMKREKPSRVTYTLEPQGKLVRLTVTHENFTDGSKTLPSVSFGWPMVLSSLKSVLETGKPLDLTPPLIAETEAEHGRA
ncbi:MAG: SRPBCC family protein [Xanthobacteraceae bacterium]|nr:SRPBCC family protein [Xanthobacteraceae bacterium]